LVNWISIVLGVLAIIVFLDGPSRLSHRTWGGWLGVGLALLTSSWMIQLLLVTSQHHLN